MWKTFTEILLVLIGVLMNLHKFEDDHGYEDYDYLRIDELRMKSEGN